MPRNTGLPVVPQELCEIIVDFSRDDLSTLAACSLVSSAWLPISRKHTFSAITLRTSSDVDDLLTISSAGLLGSNHIPRLVRDLCIGGDRDDNQSVLLNPRLRDLFEQFTSVKTLRLRYLKWLEVSAGHEPVRVLASKATHLHMHYLVFHAQVNLIQLLCSSPEKRSLNITGLGFHVMVPEALCRAEDLAFISPVVHIASMTTNFVSFICFHLTMHWAYISNCPLSLSIDRLTINDYGPEHTVSSAHDLDSITTIYIDFLEMQLEDSAEHALARGVDDEDIPTTVLKVDSVQINGPVILQRSAAVFSQMLLLALRRRLLRTRRLHFVLDGLQPEDAEPVQCDDLDVALANHATKDQRLDVIVFDVQSPAARLADWVETISSCVPRLLAQCGAHVGIVCSATRGGLQGERTTVAEHWWS